MSEIIQQTQEWHDLRKNSIGSSDAPVIMGVSPWKTPYRLWEEKMGIKESFSGSRAMKRGLEMEDPARVEFESLMGVKVDPKVVFHKEYKWMIASLDGIDETGTISVEIKSPGNVDHQLAKEGIVPTHYYPQVQHQMEVCGLDKMYYFSFDGSQGVMLEVGRDDKYIQEMLLKEKQFLECMENFVPPEMNSKDYLNKEGDMEWKRLVEERRYIQNQLFHWDQKEKENKENLLKICGEENSYGYGLKITRVNSKGNIDYKSIPELKEMDLEKYRKKASSYWRINLTNDPNFKLD